MLQAVHLGVSGARCALSRPPFRDEFNVVANIVMRQSPGKNGVQYRVRKSLASRDQAVELKAI